jgi:hypothetical protein
VQSANRAAFKIVWRRSICFPHIEHEDRQDLENRERDYEQGERMVERYRSRKRTLGKLLNPKSKRTASKNKDG